MAGDRLRRPALDRQGPVRNSVMRGATPAGSRQDNGVQPGGRSHRPAPGTLQGAVEKTVAAAYALSDQLMHRGYSAASHYSRPFGGPNMSDPHHRGPRDGWSSPFSPPPGGRPGSEGGSGPWDARGPMGVWMEPWLQMMRLWTDSLYAMSGSTNPMATWGSGAGRSTSPGTSVQVQSIRPTRVTMDLAPGADLEELVVGPLHLSGDAEATTLHGVTLSSRPGQYTVELDVSDDQAPGVYVATVENRWRRPLGELRVEITGEASKAAGKKRKSPAKKSPAKKSKRGAAKKGSSKK